MINGGGHSKVLKLDVPAGKCRNISTFDLEVDVERDVAHRGADRPLASASCLDEERRLLRFDDGRTVPLREVVDPAAVTLQTLATPGMGSFAYGRAGRKVALPGKRWW